MKKFFFKSILFWFVLLIIALVNATIRESTYKPLLEPLIGIWAHQISSITGILLFFIAIFLYLKYTKESYSKKDLAIVGIIWIFMTLIFECFMNYFLRHLTIEEILKTYYFWNGELWIFVLLSLIISPLIANKIINKN